MTELLSKHRVNLNGKTTRPAIYPQLIGTTKHLGVKMDKNMDYEKEDLSKFKATELLKLYLCRQLENSKKSQWFKPANIIAVLSVCATLVTGFSTYFVSAINSDLNQDLSIKEATIGGLESEIKEKTETNITVKSILNEEGVQTKDKKVVYTQYSGNISENFKASYRAKLENITDFDIRVPGFERIDGIKASDIRISHTEDKDAAIEVKQQVTDLLEEIGCKYKTLEENSLVGKKKKNGNGIIEVWINLDGCE